jgi:hypothetical protein
VIARKPMQLRLPHELKDWIKSEAERNGSSQNSEIVRAIRAVMEIHPAAPSNVQVKNSIVTAADAVSDKTGGVTEPR